MTELELTTKNPARLDADALVVAVVKETDGPRVLDAALPARARSALTDLLPALGVTGKAGEVVRVPLPGLAARVAVLTGTGPESGTEALRRAAGAAVRSLTGLGTVVLALPAQDPEHVAAVAEGALLGAYRFADYTDGAPAAVTRLLLASPVARSKAARHAVARSATVARAVGGVRDLVNASPRHLYPGSFAERAVAAAEGTSVSVEVLDEVTLAEGGYGGLVGVGQGSARPPRLVRLEYAPARARVHYALVGKGITFDSGGLSLKPAKGMESMKEDMAGAATVLHAVLAAAALELPVQLTGWLALAENMPGGGAQRPSDVITTRDGTTVEVLNTDAEGRLVLADALAAAREDGPDAIVDIATLTGAQMIALGSRVGAVMGTEDLRAAVVRAADTAGEQFWPMPLPQELRESLSSPVADLANMGERYGGMLVAGLFLREFVGDVPWAHLDVAGPAFNEGSAHGYTPKGGTGMGLRTLLGLVEAAARS